MSERQTGDEWRAIAARIIANRRELQETWGAADDLLIAKYLGGRCSEDERRQVEDWIERFPAVRELVEWTRASLTTDETVVSLSAALDGIWQKTTDAARRLRESVAAWVGAGHELLTSGMPTCATPLAPAVAGRTMNQDLTKTREWTIPLAPTDSHLKLRIQTTTGREWQVLLATEPRLPDAWLELGRPNEPSDLSDRLGNWESRVLALASGSWLVELRESGRTWQIPLELGSPE